MNITAQKTLKKIRWPLGIAIVIALYFSDNIRGYYRFKEICANDAGLAIYEPLQKGMGWSSSKFDAGYLLNNYDGINFVRFIDDQQSFRDLVRTNARKDFWDDGFKPQPIDITRQPHYSYAAENKKIETEVRLNSYSKIIRSIQNGKVVVMYRDFAYKLFVPDWGTSGGLIFCKSTTQDDLSKAPNQNPERAIRSSFSK
jgi:hypothetical protein